MIPLRSLFGLLLLTVLCCCGKAVVVEEEAAAEAGKTKAAAAAAVSPPAPAPVPAVPPLVLTPEMTSAVVGVRVSVAATLLREHTGVLLPAGTLKPGVGRESLRRFVAVLLPTFDEAGLRDPACTIKVLRGKFDAAGAPYVLQHAGLLVQWDAATHVGVVQFTEDFPYRLDPGLEPAGGAAPAEGAVLQVLPGAYEAPGAGEVQRAVMPQGLALPGRLAVSAQPVRLHAGALVAEGAAAGAGTGAAARLNAAAVLSEQGRLAGFARRGAGAAGGWEFVPFTPPAVVVEAGVRYTPLSVSLTSRESSYLSSQGTFRVTVRGELQDALEERPVCKVAVRHVDEPVLPPVLEGAEDQPAIEPDLDLIKPQQQKDGTLVFNLTVPPEMSTAHLLVQVWLARRQGEVLFHSKPFLVVAQRRGAGFYQHVAGLPGTSDSPPPGLDGKPLTEAANMPPQPPRPRGVTGGPEVQMPPQPPGTRPAPAEPLRPEPVLAAETARVELKTESRILYGLPLREGREVLLRLDGAPFWRRLSLAERRWLPLPEGDLSLCVLTGNREAIFILDPARHELRRHDAESLRLEKTVLLPEGGQYLGVAAGCLSDDSPVAVLMERTVLPCDARTLEPALHTLTTPPGDEPPLSGMNHYYLASGDGLMVWGRPLNARDSANTRPVFSYAGALAGYSRSWVAEVSRDTGLGKLGRLPTMAAACQWREGMLRPEMTTGTHQHVFAPWQRTAGGPLACSPCFFAVRQAVAGRDGGAPGPARCSFFSYFAAEPWATVDVPEAGDVPTTMWESMESRVWLDVQSMTFALWHEERTITLHALDRARLPEPGVPVLLNYPDCHVQRGGELHFKPLLLGGGAQVSVAETPEGMEVGADGALDWEVPLLALPEKAELSLTVGGGRGLLRPAVVPVSVRLGGMRPAALVPAALNAESAEAALEAAGRKGARTPVVPLSSRLHASERPILRVLPGLNEYVALSLEDGTLELLSVKDWKVAGSYRVGDAAAAFMAGDGVLIYSTLTRELTRHALPDFTVTARLRMPRSSRLCGLGVGSDAAGPVSLMLTEQVPQPQQKKGAAPMLPMTVNSMLTVDKQTLAAGKWPPYTPKTAPGALDMVKNHSLNQMKLPILLPTSNDGRLVSLERGLLVVTPVLTTGLSYSGPPNPSGYMGAHLYFHPQMAEQPVIASPAGGRVFSQGQMFLDSYPVFKVAEPGVFSTTSRCGNYCAALRKEDSGALQLRLYAADDGRALGSVAGLEVLQVSDVRRYSSSGSENARRRQMMPLGELNKLAVLSRGGRLLQLIDLDAGAACASLSPEWAYVTSHPFPLVTAGRTLDYQMAVNNPKAVDHYELRDQVPGATMDKTGHLTYQAPAPPAAKEPMKVTMSVLVHLKNGEKLLHEFPVHVIVPKPAPKAAAPKPAAESGGKKGAKGK